MLQNPARAHVVPVNDLRAHVSDSACWCSPTENESIFTHNAMDCREQYERGERKAS